MPAALKFSHQRLVRYLLSCVPRVVLRVQVDWARATVLNSRLSPRGKCLAGSVSSFESFVMRVEEPQDSPEFVECLFLAAVILLGEAGLQHFHLSVPGSLLRSSVYITPLSGVLDIFASFGFYRVCIEPTQNPE